MVYVVARDNDDDDDATVAMMHMLARNFLLIRHATVMAVASATGLLFSNLYCPFVSSGMTLMVIMRCVIGHSVV